jgi:hypothetical protein
MNPLSIDQIESSQGPKMNESERSAAATAALTVIKNIAYLAREDPPRPVLVRFAWFCAGAVFVLATVRARPSGPPEAVNA